MKGALCGSVFTVLMRSLYKLTDMFNKQLLSEEKQVKHCAGRRVAGSARVKHFTLCLRSVFICSLLSDGHKESLFI